MKPRVYLETTVVSYLTAWPSRDIVVAAHQQVTRDWWKTCPDRFEVVGSELIVQEAREGDEEAAGVEYLVTWNCRHLANATMREQIETACRAAGYRPPIICTPEELLESDDHD